MDMPLCSLEHLSTVKADLSLKRLMLPPRFNAVSEDWHQRDELPNNLTALRFTCIDFGHSFEPVFTFGMPRP
jgi:hypothetical protein